jgi:hypothetical protein
MASFPIADPSFEIIGFTKLRVGLVAKRCRGVLDRSDRVLHRPPAILVTRPDPIAGRPMHLIYAHDRHRCEMRVSIARQRGGAVGDISQLAT